MSRLTIRRFQPEDARKVSYIIRKCLYEVNVQDYALDVVDLKSNEASPAKIKKMAEQRYFIVGLVDGQIVACTTWFGKIIRTLFVNPRFHRMGIGTKMMRYLEIKAKNAGIKKIEIPASMTAFRLGFYQKLGYKTVRHYREDGKVPAVLMTKRFT